MISYLLIFTGVYLDVAVRHTNFLSIISFTGVAVVTLLILRDHDLNVLIRQGAFASLLFGLFLQENLGLVLVAATIPTLVIYYLPKALTNFRDVMFSLGFFSILTLVLEQGRNTDRILAAIVINTVIILSIAYLLKRFSGYGRKSFKLK